MKKQITASILALTTAFSGAKGDDLAQQHTAPEPNLIELTEDKPINSTTSTTAAFTENADSTTTGEKNKDNRSTGSLAVVREGGAGKAQSYSGLKDIITVHMAAGTNSAMRDKYIEGVKALFKSEKYTDSNATDIAVFYSDDILPKGALFSVYINGEELIEDAVTLSQLKEEAPDIAADYFRRKESQRVATYDPQSN